MTTILIDLVLGFWLLLFGGLAVLPMLTKGSRQQASHPAEDRVISIAPARPMPRPSSRQAPPLPGHDHDQRPAA